MAEIRDRRLYLTEKERPEWWKKGQFVRVLLEKENSFFLWHKTEDGAGHRLIDDFLSIQLDVRTPNWYVKEHSPECICLFGEKTKKIVDKAEKAREKFEDISEDLEFPISIDLRDIGNMSKEKYIQAYKELLGVMLMGGVGVKQYKEAREALTTLLREYEVFDETHEEKKINSLEDIKQMLLQKAQDPNTNIIDLIRTIKSLDEDGQINKKERVLDEIIIDTEEEGDNLEDLEIEI